MWAASCRQRVRGGAGELGACVRPSAAWHQPSCCTHAAAPGPAVPQVGPKLPPVELNDDGSLKYESVMKVG